MRVATIHFTGEIPDGLGPMRRGLGPTRPPQILTQRLSVHTHAAPDSHFGLGSAENQEST